MERYEAIEKIKSFCSWLEDHPDVPFPYSLWVWDDHVQIEKFCCTRSQLEATARAFEKASKGISGDQFKVEGSPIPGVTYAVHGNRESVCTRRVVGTKHVEEIIIPEKTIEAHDEEIVEWDCGSLLEPKETTPVDTGDL